MTIEKIDICMTATIRPSVLNETLKSFAENMLKEKLMYRLIINIDPIGEQSKRKNVLKVAGSYFDDIVYNLPDMPGFTKAVQWCWSRTTSRYVFHLEDDWKLLIPINIKSMIEILDKYENLVSLRLNKEKTGKSKHSNKFGFIYYPKISLNPTIFNGDFIRNIYPLMNLQKNPEKQLRANETTERGRYISKFQHGVYTKESVNQVVKDIGRTWMQSSSYTKKTGFMNWEKKIENSSIK